MRYLAFILIILCACGVRAQVRYPTGFPTQFNTGWNRWGYAQSDSGLIIANRDTTFLPKFSGTIVYRPTNKQFYWFDSTNLTWHLFGTNIDTTSLSNRINLKLNIVDTTNKWWSINKRWVDTVYRVNDSTVGFTINNGAPQTFQILGRSQGGGGGSGTVTSVALSMPSAFSVSGSPVTSSGTFNVSGAGTTAQYIRGNGTLATTDTGMIPNFYLKVRSLISATSPLSYNSSTGVLNIANANTSGQKGAATFLNSDFSDNGSGMISLSTLVSNGSCTNCSVTFGADGRATAYSTGTGPAGVSVDTIFRTAGIDSIYFKINGVQYAIKDSAGSTETANNGLTKTGNNIQLGGALIQATNITSAVGANRIIYSGVSSFSDGAQLDVSTSGSGGIGVRGTTTDGRGVFGLATGNGVGLYAGATGSGGIGLFSTTTDGSAIYTTTNAGGLLFEGFSDPTSINTVIPLASLTRSSQSTGANGIGGSIDINLRTTAADRQSNQIIFKLTNATDASYASAIEFWNANSATVARKALLAASGQWTWDGYPSLTGQTDTTTYKPIAIDGSGNVVRMSNWFGSGGGGGSFSTTNLGSGYRWVATTSGSIKTAFGSNTILIDSTSNANGLTIKGDTSYLATQSDLLAAQYIVGRNLRVISGTPDTLATKDTLISITPATNDSSSYVATTAWVKRQTFSSGTATAAGATGDIQFKGSDGLFKAQPGGFFKWDSTGKRLLIGNPSVLNNMIEVDSGDINMNTGGYKIDDGYMMRMVGGSVTRVNEAAFSGSLRFYVDGASKMILESAVLQVTPPIDESTTYRIGGVDVIKDFGTEIGFGSVTSFWSKVRFYANGVQVGMIDTSRWGLNTTAPLAVLHVKPQGTGQYQGGFILDSMSLRSTPQPYLFETNGTGIWWTDRTGTRYRLDSTGSTVTTLYSGDGTLAATRTVSGGGNSLNFGSGGSKVALFTINSSSRTVLNSGITYGIDATNTDANYTVPGTVIIAELNDVLSAGRTLTLPSASTNGQCITLVMRFSSGTNKYSLSAAIVDNATGSTFTTLDWGKTYDFMVDQSLTWRLIRKY